MSGFLLSLIKQQLCLTPKRSICLQRRIKAGVFNRHFKSNNNSLSCLPINGVQLRRWGRDLEVKIPIGLNYCVSLATWAGLERMNGSAWADIICYLALADWLNVYLLAVVTLVRCPPVWVSPSHSLLLDAWVGQLANWSPCTKPTRIIWLYYTHYHTLLHAEPKILCSSLTLSVSLLPTSF